MTGIALIGLGMAVAPHARSLLDLAGEAEVIGAFSPSAKRRKAFGAQFPFPLADDLDELLAEPRVEAAMILAPPYTHLDLVGKAAAAGKHVLLEKPLEISTGRARALIAACRSAGVKLGIVLQHRYRPSALRLKELQGEREFGRLIAASATVWNWRPQSYYDQPGRGTRARDGGGVLLTQGVHTLDLMLHLAGVPEEVQAYAATSPVHRMETEDLACAALRFPGGALGTVAATTAAYPGYAERIELIWERASAVLTGARLAVAFPDGGGETLEPAEETGGAGADPMAFPHTQHREVLRGFLAALREGRDPPITGETALDAHLLIDAILASAAERRPVRLDR
jgi:UDP-N-acetyl-2-amino-2-deoxyglucuronate dehydrogenase